MSTSAYSSSAPWSFTSERDSFCDEDHNEWNGLIVVLPRHQCSPWVQQCLREGDLLKVALSSHLTLDLLTIGELQVARVRRRSGTKSSRG